MFNNKPSSEGLNTQSPASHDIPTSINGLKDSYGETNSSEARADVDHKRNLGRRRSFSPRST